MGAQSRTAGLNIVGSCDHRYLQYTGWFFFVVLISILLSGRSFVYTAVLFDGPITSSANWFASIGFFIGYVQVVGKGCGKLFEN